MNLKKRLLSAIAALAVGFTMFALPTSATPTGSITTIVQVGLAAQQAKATVNTDLVLTAKDAGAAGNSIKITIVVSGNSTPLSVSVVTQAITVNAATDGTGAATSTTSEMAIAISNDNSAKALVTATGGSTTATGISQTSLSGGADVGKDTITAINYAISVPYDTAKSDVENYIKTLAPGGTAAGLASTAIGTFTFTSADTKFTNTFTESGKPNGNLALSSQGQGTYTLNNNCVTVTVTVALTSVPATVAGVSVPFGTAVADVQKALPATITGVQTYQSTGWVNTDSYSDTTAVGQTKTFTLTPTMAAGYKLASGSTITCQVTVAAAGGGGSTATPSPDSPGTSVNEKTDGTTEKIVDPSSVLAALINGGDAKCEIYSTTGKDGKATTFSVKANKNTAANMPTADELRKITEILKTLSAKPTKESQAAFDALVKSDKNKDVKGMVISFADHGELNFDLEISMPVDTSIFKDGTTHDLYYFNPKTGVLELVGTSKIVGDKAVFTLNKLCVYYLTNTKMDLSAGEGVAVTTEAIATTAAVAETTAAPVATTPATNPTTGNAPIALALIPVAAIAAFVLAKKSK